MHFILMSHVKYYTAMVYFKKIVWFFIIGDDVHDFALEKSPGQNHEAK